MNNLKQRFKDDPSEVLIEKLLEVVEQTKNPNVKFEALKMIYSLQDDHIC